MEKRKSQMGKLMAAAAASVGLAGFGASQADASLIVDVRATAVNGVGTADGKAATVSVPGDTVTLSVFARINGTDGINNEQLGALHGSLVTSGSMLGNLQGGRFAPFTGSSSQNGSVQDIDSDGDLDIGSIGSSVSGKFVARSDAPTPASTIIDANTGEVKVGEFTFTYTGGGQETFANFVTRKNATGGNLFSAATWFEDTLSKAPTVGTYDVGAPVQIVVPEPASAALLGLASLGLLARRRNA